MGLSPKVLRVLGSAPCLQEDMENAPSGEQMAVNRAGVFIKDIQHWASTHEFLFPEFLRERKANGLSIKGFTMHAPGSGPDIRVWKLRRNSSGLFAALVGIKLGYNPVILCGCPMTGANQFEGINGNYEAAHDSWLQDLDNMKGKVFSMSGQTKEWLGGPR